MMTTQTIAMKKKSSARPIGRRSTVAAAGGTAAAAAAALIVAMLLAAVPNRGAASAFSARPRVVRFDRLGERRHHPSKPPSLPPFRPCDEGCRADSKRAFHPRDDGRRTSSSLLGPLLPPSSSALGTLSSAAVNDANDRNGEGEGEGRNEVRDDEANILGAAVAVGAITAAMGHVYGKVLGLSVRAVWKTIPLFLSSRLGVHDIILNPRYFIIGTLTLGGALVGVLSSKFHSKSYTVADFVSAFSSVPAEARTLPRTRNALPPLLLLSLLTSAFGFSVGPEAPMVCAGGLVGTSVARMLYGDDRDAATDAAGNTEGDDTPSDVVDGNESLRPPGFESKSEAALAEHLAYAGAAGALTAFMGMPIAGSIFALELTRSSAGLSSGARDALSPAVAASVAAIAVIRALINPGAAVGGHFSYGPIGGVTGAAGIVSGRDMMLTAVGCGVGGALIGTVFHKSVSAMKGLLWRDSGNAKGSRKGGGGEWKRTVLTKATVGLLVGLLSSYYPQTLFWGEGSLQTVIDGQLTPFSATKHGLPSLLLSTAKVDPSVPFQTAKAAASVGAAKLLSIALACAGKFPGGIIFPLFFAAAPFAHAASLSEYISGGPALLPVAVMSLMASTQASVTRTPLATALILTLSASAGTEVSVMLPATLVSSYLGVYVSQLLSRKSYFSYAK